MLKKSYLAPSLILLAVCLAWVLRPVDHDSEPSATEQMKEVAAPVNLKPSAAPQHVTNLQRTQLPTKRPSNEENHTAQGESLFRLQVIDTTTQTALANAVVYEVYNPWSKQDERHFLLFRHHAWFSDIERFNQSLLTRHQANAEGVVVLDATQPRSTKFFSRHGTLWGQTHVAIKSDKTATLELYQDRSITVLALDDLGQPLAGIAVGLVQQTPDAKQTVFIRYDISNDMGIATLSHLPATAKEGARYFVRPRIPMIEQVAVEVFLDKLPNEAVSLQLPPLGHLELSILEADGTPLAGNFDLEVLLDPNPVSGRSQAELEDVLERAAPHQVFRSPGQHGKTSFPFVGLGLNLLLSTQSFDDDWFLTPGKGPTRPDETVTLTLQRPQPQGFRLRLLNSKSEPLPNLNIGTKVRLEKENSGSSAHGFAETDGQGVLTITFDQEDLELLDGASVAQLEIRFHTIVPPRRYQASIKLPSGMDHGLHDLGDVIMLAQKPLLVGKVVDMQQHPIEGAQAWIRKGIVENGVRSWTSVGLDYSNAEGDFYIYGETPSGPTRFTVYKEGFLLHSSEETPNSEAIVTLSTGSRIQGSLLLPDEYSQIPLQITYRLSETLEASEQSIAFLTNGNRDFYLSGLGANPVDLFLRTRTGKILLATQYSVLPWQDESQADTRLAPWILDQTLFLYSINVVDSSGAAVPQLKLQLLDDSFEHSPSAFHVPWQVLLPMPVISSAARLTAPGFRTKELLLQAGEQTILLSAGLSVRFELQNPPSLQPGMRIACRSQTTDSRSWQYEHELLFSSWQDLQLAFQEPGRHRIEIQLVSAGQEAWLESSEILIDHWFEIDNRAQEQVVVLTE